MEVTQGDEGGVAACVFGWLQLNGNGYMERSYRNTMHDSKRFCLKEVIIILESSETIRAMTVRVFQQENITTVLWF